MNGGIMGVTIGRGGRVEVDPRRVEEAYRAPGMRPGRGPRQVRQVRGIGLPEGVDNPREALRVEMFRAVLRHGDVFVPSPIPESAKDFRDNWWDPVLGFEMMRQTSPRRVIVADEILDNGLDFYRYGDVYGRVMTVREALELPVGPLPHESLTHPQARQARGYRAGVTYEGRRYETREDLHALADQLLEGNLISKGAAEALKWIADYAHDRGGFINVRDLNLHNTHLFYESGGTAELATPDLALQAGFDVFTTHLTPADLEPVLARVVESHVPFAGRLVWARNGTNVLTQLPETVATVQAVASGRRLMVSHSLYAGGGGRETLLGVAADAQNYALGPVMDALFYKQSPSTGAHEIPAGLARRIIETQGDGNITVRSDGRAFVHNIWHDQGPSYQNQNQRKRWSAEVALTRGLGPSRRRHPMISSINVGPIANTASMDTPFIQNAFTQAARYGVRVAEPQTFREVMWLLQLHDLINTQAPSHPQRQSAGTPEPQRGDGPQRGSWEHADAGRLSGQHVDFGAYRVGGDFNAVVTRAGVQGAIRHPIAAARDRLPVVGRVFDAVDVARAPRRFEEAVRHMEGPLARAFTGGGEAQPVRHIFLGDADVIPPNGPRAMAFFAGANRAPFVGATAQLLAGQRMHPSVYGDALTSDVFGQLMGHRTGPRDRVEFLTPPDSPNVLAGVRVSRSNGQHVEWRDSGRTTPEGQPILQQVVYFGRSLPDMRDPREEVSEMAVDFAYDTARGEMRSLGPRAVNPEIVGRRVDAGSHVMTPEQVALFGRLVAPGQSPEEIAYGLTFAPNSGVLGPVLRGVVLDPRSGIDFNRVMVHALEFRRGVGDQSPLVGREIHTTVLPNVIQRTERGEIVQAEIMMSPTPGGRPFRTVEASLIVRGNFPQGRRGPDIEPDSHVTDHHLGDRGEAPLTFRAMSADQLPLFARLNGDWNPLHQADGVGWTAGLPGVVNPGFGTMAQVEAALRGRLGPRTVWVLHGRLVRPVLPGREYQVELGSLPQEGSSQLSWAHFQVVDPSRRNKEGDLPVVVNGRLML
ncbi:MAG: hypothetical protein A3I75_04505 [Deltaproteobacteria bacterium RIFCSPLOWO2_02_FULL_50_16]|nr:MAG: hypothetical protein A3I75_04505 [Deltaproteobacteria bacterium RIFCSPLOWO2_02_FULL_50_16]